MPRYLFIFSFQFSLLFFHISVARQHQHSSVLLVLIRNIGHRMLPKIWVGRAYLSRVERTAQGDFKKITVKVETRSPVEGQFGSEFPAICNHCVVMTVWSRKTSKFCEHFLGFLNDPYGKIFKILFGKCSPPHRSTLLCWNFVKFIRRQMGEIVLCLHDK